MKAGDTIRCHDKDDAIVYAEELTKAGYKWDFSYEKDGEKGIWIVILGGGENESH